MTDDNDDGKIDENDIPEVAFMTTATDYYNPGVVRILSGDTGLELASSEELYYGSDNLAAADFDNDTVLYGKFLCPGELRGPLSRLYGAAGAVEYGDVDGAGAEACAQLHG